MKRLIGQPAAEMQPFENVPHVCRSPSLVWRTRSWTYGLHAG